MEENSIIKKLIKYFEKVLKDLKNENVDINCDFLGDDVGSFSLEPIASKPIVEEYLDGSYLAQFTFCLASRKSYSQDKVQNTLTSEFGDMLTKLIKEKNNNSDLPEIDGIESIEVTGSPFAYQTGMNTARYQLNMRITYYVGG